MDDKITSILNAIDNRIAATDKKLTDLCDTSAKHNTTQASLHTNVAEIIKKFEKASTKGNMSEHILHNILLALFPCAQIDHVGNEQKETGDIIFMRTNKPKVLIENKEYDSKNVPKQEVDKFIRDCEIQNCCGIMFAQHHGIANKENYEIQLHRGNVMLYVHEVKFDCDKIKTAIEIVEQFKTRLDELYTDTDDYVIEQDTLDDINGEYTMFLQQKNGVMKSVKELGEKLSEIQLPKLENYLSTKYAYSFSHDAVCPRCEKVVPKSMARHLRFCVKR